MEPTREGVSFNIAPSTRHVNRLTPPGAPSLQALKEELASHFRNISHLDNESLLLEPPLEEQRHNNLSPLSSPLFSRTDLPTLTPLLSSDSNNPLRSSSPTSPLLPRTLFPPPTTLLPANDSLEFTTPPLSPVLTENTVILPSIDSMPAEYYMPARGERAAPTFDQSKPRELIRFFEELEYLFERASLDKEPEKKKHVLRYVEFDVEQIWKTFPEYSDPQKSYKDFKSAILIHYPDASGDYVYSLRDMDLLIGERQRIGISNTVDLADYHLKFLSITSWLIEKQQLGTLEQERGYLRAFQPRLLGAINNRLQMKLPDHHPNIPHTVKDVYEAARFILQSATTAPQNYFAPTPPNVNPPFVPDGKVSIAKREPPVKQEDLGSLFTEFTKTIVEAIQQSSRSRYNPNTSTSDSSTRTCNFCGGQHFIRECDKVEEMIRVGKCKRNAEGKVVLPSGAYVPRDTPGTLLSERIEEWHRTHPNQLGVVTLLNTIELPKLNAVSKDQNSIVKHTFQLSTTDRIATIEAELFNLRARNAKFIPLARTRAQRARAGITDIEEESEAEVRAAVRASQQPRIEEVTDEEEEARPAVSNEATDIITAPVIPLPPVILPEHPFQKAKDAAYAPPAERNVGAPVKAPPVVRKNDPAYRTLPPVHDPSIAADVYKRSMNAPITITQRELLSLSPEVRSQVRDVTTTRRIPNNANVISQNALQLDEEDMEDAMVDSSNEALHLRRFCNHTRQPPPGAIVISDPIERYYRSLPLGESPDPDRLVVAKESSAVRSIFAVVDTTSKRECILDPGCQIVAMADDICHDLALPYDPSIRLNMQSANGTMDWSLGLARNVPFTIGNITLYMQVHIIRSPAYEILLGRPFDILTESVVKNFANEDQTITISDPNSGQCYTIPTFPRGKNLFMQCSGKGFRL